jgi:hypothetical protein
MLHKGLLKIGSQLRQYQAPGCGLINKVMTGLYPMPLFLEKHLHVNALPILHNHVYCALKAAYCDKFVK